MVIVKFRVSAGGRRFTETQPVNGVRDFVSLAEQIADEYRALYPPPTRVVAMLNTGLRYHSADERRD